MVENFNTATLTKLYAEKSLDIDDVLKENPEFTPFPNSYYVLKSENSVPNFLRISTNITPLKGEDILVLGYPYGKLTSSESKVTKGIVSALQGLANNFSQFQIDSAIQPGNSGGPVFNSKGALVGVTVATADYKFYEENFKSLPQNMNFAIKSIMLENFLASTGIKYDKANIYRYFLVIKK